MEKGEKDTMVKYEESYFEGEEREGFYIEPMVKRAWAAEVEVLQEIVKICEKHKIQYFAEWGTLLGVVRHKGFIPWDDDLDIGMKREDFRRFIKVAKKELPEGFVLMNIHTEPEYANIITRVTNSHSIRWDEEHLKRFHGFPYVAGVDIFVLDYIPRNKKAEERQCQLIQFVREVADQMTLENPTDPEIIKAIIKIQEECHVKFHHKEPLLKQLLALVEDLCGLYSEKDADEITHMPDLARGWNYHIKKESYEKFVMMPFEQIMIPVPVGYDEVLKVKYGPNYMTPIQNAASHDYPFYKEQEAMMVWMLNKEKIIAALDALIKYQNVFQTGTEEQWMFFLQKCQQTAITIGELIESSVSDAVAFDLPALIKPLEEYCEEVYLTSQDIGQWSVRRERMNMLLEQVKEMTEKM